MADKGEENTPTKRLAKKKYYPFGTPSHLHHPFSEFAHINVDNRSFAIDLATASDIKAEVIEEKPKKKRAAPIIKKKAKESTAEDGEQSGSQGADEQNSDEPCTKIPCQMVVRALADLEFKNEVERMDLEDDYERHVAELQQAEQEVHVSESKLDKLHDIGNSLEISANQLITKVETLEKAKEHLTVERNEINTKLMLLEVERQKCNRKLEKAQKELTNARWRKKKAAQAQDAEAGLSLAVSEISEAPIVHDDNPSVGNSVYRTDYSRMSKVIDYMEEPPTLKTVPLLLQETYFQHPEALDKYAQSHYTKVISHSLESWDRQAGSSLACSLKALKFKPAQSLEDDMSSVGRTRGGMSIGSSQLLSSASSGIFSSMGGSLSRNTNSRVLSRAGGRIVSTSSLSKNKSISLMESVYSLKEHIKHSPTHSITAPRSIMTLGDSLDAPLSLLSVESEESMLEILAEEGIHIDSAGRGLEKKRLDGTFFDDTARADYGRKHIVGYVRSAPPRDIKPSSYKEGENGKEKKPRKRSMQSNELDLRNLPKLKSLVLTTKHPGMSTFAHAATMSFNKTT